MNSLPEGVTCSEKRCFSFKHLYSWKCEPAHCCSLDKSSHKSVDDSLTLRVFCISDPKQQGDKHTLDVSLNGYYAMQKKKREKKKELL